MHLRPALLVLGLSAAALATTAASCGTAPADGSPAVTPAATASAAPAPSAAASASLEDQCAAAAPLLRLVDRSFLGSDEHLAQYDAMIAVAPADLVDDLRTTRAYYADPANQADPDAWDTENFPPAVLDAALAAQEGLTDLCG